MGLAGPRKPIPCFSCFSLFVSYPRPSPPSPTYTSHIHTSPHFPAAFSTDVLRFVMLKKPIPCFSLFASYPRPSPPFPTPTPTCRYTLPHRFPLTVNDFEACDAKETIIMLLLLSPTNGLLPSPAQAYTSHKPHCSPHNLLHQCLTKHCSYLKLPLLVPTLSMYRHTLSLAVVIYLMFGIL